MFDDFLLRTLQPSSHDLGGFKVHRTLPNKERTMVGPFIFFDQMGPAQLLPGSGIDVRPHPHINLSTVTYLFDGAIGHRDSLGSDLVIEPGAVNLMTAGSGIVHSERSPGEVRPQGPVLSGIQTWLAMPEAVEEIDPAFEHIPPMRCRRSRGRGRPRGSSWGNCGASVRRRPPMRAPSMPTSRWSRAGVSHRSVGRGARRLLRAG